MRGRCCSQCRGRSHIFHMLCRKARPRGTVEPYNCLQVNVARQFAGPHLKVKGLALQARAAVASVMGPGTAPGAVGRRRGRGTRGTGRGALGPGARSLGGRRAPRGTGRRGGRWAGRYGSGAGRETSLLGKLAMAMAPDDDVDLPASEVGLGCLFPLPHQQLFSPSPFQKKGGKRGKRNIRKLDRQVPHIQTQCLCLAGRCAYAYNSPVTSVLLY